MGICAHLYECICHVSSVIGRHGSLGAGLVSCSQWVIGIYLGSPGIEVCAFDSFAIVQPCFPHVSLFQKQQYSSCLVESGELSHPYAIALEASVERLTQSRLKGLVSSAAAALACTRLWVQTSASQQTNSTQNKALRLK